MAPRLTEQTYPPVQRNQATALLKPTLNGIKECPVQYIPYLFGQLYEQRWKDASHKMLGDPSYLGISTKVVLHGAERRASCISTAVPLAFLSPSHAPAIKVRRSTLKPPTQALTTPFTMYPSRSEHISHELMSELMGWNAH